MKPILLLLMIGTFSCHAVLYDRFEIQNELNRAELHQLSAQYLNKYFTASKPAAVIEQINSADFTPLQREYIFYNLLDEIAHQPKQAFHQQFVNQMKVYASQAATTADEGPIPIAVFNLNSKAYGIENIWTAHATTNLLNRLFNQDVRQAVAQIKTMIATDSRPTWLGVKNSVATLTLQQQHELSEYLLSHTKVNDGLDLLISHVGLNFTDHALLHKALQSNQQYIRELTLRSISQKLSATEVINYLLTAASSGADVQFATSLLGPYSHQEEVKTFLFKQLNNQKNAAKAAFALSQSTDSSMAQQIKNQYLKSTNDTTRNHLLLALKLNDSPNARMVIDELLQYEYTPKAQKWLKSFSETTLGDDS